MLAIVRKPDGSAGCGTNNLPRALKTAIDMGGAVEILADETTDALCQLCEDQRVEIDSIIKKYQASLALNVALKETVDDLSHKLSEAREIIEAHAGSEFFPETGSAECLGNPRAAKVSG